MMTSELCFNSMSTVVGCKHADLLSGCCGASAAGCSSRADALRVGPASGCFFCCAACVAEGSLLEGLTWGSSGAATRRILNVRVAPMDSDAMMHIGPSIVSRSASRNVAIVKTRVVQPAARWLRVVSYQCLPE